MFNIALYLEKFKNFGQSERQLKEILISAIKSAVGIEVEAKSIVIKNGEAVIKVSPSIKNAIFIKKEKILKEVSEKIDGKVEEIR